MVAKQDYEQLIARTRSAMEWIDDPKRTREEVDKWYPKYIAMFNEITRIERIMRS